jgi:hypothetical protein
VPEIIYGGVPGMQNMSSRLFLKRLLSETMEITENIKEAREIIDALAACDSQTAVENDMKVRSLQSPVKQPDTAGSYMYASRSQASLP